MWRMLMLSLIMLSGWICPRVMWKVVTMAIVSHDHAADGQAFWMAMRYTLRKGKRGGWASCDVGMFWRV